MKYEDAKQILHALEQDPEITGPQLHGWILWSVVKRALFHRMLGKTETIGQAISKARRLRQVVDVAWGGIVGFWQLMGKAGMLCRPHVLIMSPAHARSMPDQLDGTHHNIFFDDLLLSGKLSLPAVLIETSVTGRHKQPPIGIRPVNGECLYLLMRLLSFFCARSKSELAAKRLVSIIARKDASLGGPRIQRLIFQYALRFAVELMMYRAIFRFLPTKAVLTIDGLNRPGLLAAARERAIHVYDFQHGIIGRRHAAYWIDEGLRPHKPKIPLPTRIMVYGPLWQQLVSECGFWDPQDIACVGSARMDRFLSVHRDAESPSMQPIQLLFTSQWISRTDALIFWREFLSHPKPFDYKLVIKVHPLEWEGVELYKALEREAPGRCKVVFLEQDTYGLLKTCDFHISYQSTVLVESIAMGRPTVSISSATSPKGFIGSLGLTELADAILTVGTPSELSEIACRYAADDNYRKALLGSVEQVGKGLYTTGFIQKVSEQVNASVE